MSEERDNLVEKHELPLIEKFQPTYLGDSVYMRFDGYAFVIYTDNGMGAENEIYLEPDVIDSLQRYVDKVAETIKALRG